MPSTIISSQKFTISDEVKEDHLRWVEAKAEIKSALGPDLLSAGLTPFGSLSVDEEGNPVEVSHNVTSHNDKYRFRFDANKLFPKAPAGARFMSGPLNLSIFDFPLGSWSSKFVSSKDMNVVIQIGLDVKLGTIARADVEKWGEPVFLVKAHISLTKDLGKGQLQICCIPYGEDKAASLPGFSLDSTLYPSVLVYASSLIVGPVSQYQDGIPLVPFLWTTEKEKPVPNLCGVRSAIRAMMAVPYMSLARTRQDFDEVTKNTTVTPDMPQVAQEYA